VITLFGIVFPGCCFQASAALHDGGIFDFWGWRYAWRYWLRGFSACSFGSFHRTSTLRT